MDQLMRSFGAYFPLLLIATPAVLLATGVAIWTHDRFRFGPRFFWRTVLDAGLVLWVGAAAAITLLAVTTTYGGRPLDLVPFASIISLLRDSVTPSAAAAQIAGNVVLFVPLGLLARLRFDWKTGRCAVLGAGVAVTIEFLQFALGTGRVASTDDVILAVVGTAFGAIAARIAPTWLSSRYSGQRADQESMAAGRR